MARGHPLVGPSCAGARCGHGRGSRRERPARSETEDEHADCARTALTSTTRFGEGEPLVLTPTWLPTRRVMHSRSRSTRSTSTASRWIFVAPSWRDKPVGTYTTELFADDVAPFISAVGVERAHVAGLSLGAAAGMWLAAKYPDRVKVAVAAQRLAANRRVPACRRRGLAGDGAGARQRDRDGDQGDLSRSSCGPLVRRPSRPRRPRSADLGTGDGGIAVHAPWRYRTPTVHRIRIRSPNSAEEIALPSGLMRPECDGAIVRIRSTSTRRSMRRWRLPVIR